MPESLGNDVLVLSPGWVCDSCNTVFSGFENRIMNNSILGIERCRLGVTTKKRKPASACLYGITWFSEPSKPVNTVSAEAKWRAIPALLPADSTMGRVAIPMLDSSNVDMARLLLKIGVELLAVWSEFSGSTWNCSAARAFILGKETEPWPYFVLSSNRLPHQLVSVLSSTPHEHRHIRKCGFDVFLHQVEEHALLFFLYGHFLGAASTTSRNTGWASIFSEWNTSFVLCPADFSEPSL